MNNAARNLEISSYDDKFQNGKYKIACVVDKPIRQRTERFTSREEINSVVEYFLKRHEIHMTAYFIYELNVGYRVGDCLSFRKCDMVMPDKPLQLRQQLTLVEGKTRKYNKCRTVYFNKAVMAVFGQAYELTDRFNCRRNKCLPDALESKEVNEQ